MAREWLHPATHAVHTGKTTQSTEPGNSSFSAIRNKDEACYILVIWANWKLSPFMISRHGAQERSRAQQGAIPFWTAGPPGMTPWGGKQHLCPSPVLNKIHCTGQTLLRPGALQRHPAAAKAELWWFQLLRTSDSERCCCPSVSLHLVQMLCACSAPLVCCQLLHLFLPFPRPNRGQRKTCCKKCPLPVFSPSGSLSLRAGLQVLHLIKTRRYKPLASRQTQNHRIES